MYVQQQLAVGDEMNITLAPFYRQSIPVTSVGIIYATSTKSAQGREEEKMADCEVIEVAQAVQSALASQGIRTDSVNLAMTPIENLRQYDWIFNLSETIYGFSLTDDQVAEAMEKLGIGFTGSGSRTLKACRDKALTKNELSHNGILTPAYEVYPPGAQIQNRLRFPLIAKPLYEDGSFGITKDSLSHDPKELSHSVTRIHDLYHQPALVEEYIDGRDITVSILGNGNDPVVLPLSETVYVDHGGPHFLTFQAKWVPGTDEYETSASRCPAQIDTEVGSAIAEFAVRACRIMGCRDYTRVDFRLRGKIPYVLEVNPNPCINPCDSGFVRSGKAGGYSYDALINTILEQSIRSSCLHATQMVGDLYAYTDQKPVA